MSAKINVEWTRDEEGEYNEEVATVNGHEIRVFSNRGGTDWEYLFGDNEESSGGYDTKEESQEAAITEAMEG